MELLPQLVRRRASGWDGWRNEFNDHKFVLSLLVDHVFGVRKHREHDPYKLFGLG